MSKGTVTTTKSGFRVEDVTFHKARRQSEIIDELGLDEEIVDEVEVEAPKSLTPEQVIKYYEQMIKSTQDQDSKRVYSMTIRWIRDMLEFKQTIAKYREKELRDEAMKETPDDIQADRKEEEE